MPSMTLSRGDVIVGVDTHKDEHVGVAVVLAHAGIHEQTLPDRADNPPVDRHLGFMNTLNRRSHATPARGAIPFSRIAQDSPRPS